MPLLDTISKIMTRGFVPYEHVQTTPATTWTVVHNLNTSVVSTDVQVIHRGQNKKAIPHSVTIVDNNTITINWSTAWAGTVRIS